MDMNTIADRFLLFIGVIVVFALATMVIIFRSGKEKKA